MGPTPHDVSDTDDFFEMSLDNLCVAGLDGYFKRVNPSWTRTLGWTAAELMARPSVEFVHPDDRALTLAGRQQLSIGFDMGPLINRYQCKDGSFRWFEWRSIAHLDRGLVYAAARDITAQKLAEEQLAEASQRERRLQGQLKDADRLASIGTLAGGVAHEINNPLACVIANISMMIEELQRDSRPQLELREMAGDIQYAAERIRTIVRGLTTFASTEEGRPAVIDLRRVLDLAIDLTLIQLRDRGVLVKQYGDTPPVHADEKRLGQVFLNLLMNAAQALPEEHQGSHEIRVVTMTDAAGRAVVEIRDTGSGIPVSVMPRIFDPFFTTKAIGAGTGLGLSICHSIVTALGGEISATSVPGLTILRVVLPPAVPEPSEVALPSPPTGRRAAILIVDDEPAVGAALGRLLRQHTVTVVVTAGQGLALIAAGQHFDVIFSDLIMPTVSGMDFHDELAESHPEAARRMVFMSGGAYTARASAFLDRVSNARIAKPFDAVAVRELVRQMMLP